MEDDSPARSPEFGKFFGQKQKKTKGLFSGLSLTCMGNNLTAEIPHVPNQMRAEAGLGVHNSADDLIEERESSEGVGSAGNKDGPYSDPVVGLGDFGPSVELPRPSYVTMKPNKNKVHKKFSAQTFKTPDLNNYVEGDNASDPLTSRKSLGWRKRKPKGLWNRLADPIWENRRPKVKFLI
ncbi:hypothetical protein Hanom_Chr09g00770561 [Helianthus anomalus]